jgi:hypothetical protein
MLGNFTGIHLFGVLMLKFKLPQSTSFTTAVPLSYSFSSIDEFYCWLFFTDASTVAAANPSSERGGGKRHDQFRVKISQLWFHQSGKLQNNVTNL